MYRIGRAKETFGTDNYGIRRSGVSILNSYCRRRASWRAGSADLFSKSAAFRFRTTKSRGVQEQLRATFPGPAAKTGPEGGGTHAWKKENLEAGVRSPVRGHRRAGAFEAPRRGAGKKNRRLRAGGVPPQRDFPRREFQSFTHASNSFDPSSYPSSRIASKNSSFERQVTQTCFGKSEALSFPSRGAAELKNNSALPATTVARPSRPL